MMKNTLSRMTGTAALMIGLGIVLTGCKTAEKDNGTAALNKAPGVSANKPAPGAPANGEQVPKGEVQIVIKDFVFTPADVTVTPGTKVTWINKDDVPHTATSVDKKFNSGGLDTDDKFSFVFNDKGDYPYICTLHPQMKATIKVK
jgi:plastocyanin